MSSDITIKEGEGSSLELTIRTKTLEISLWNNRFYGGVVFDLSCEKDRKEIQNLVSHLQHQLEIHKEDEE